MMRLILNEYNEKGKKIESFYKQQIQIAQLQIPINPIIEIDGNDTKINKQKI